MEICGKMNSALDHCQCAGTMPDAGKLVFWHPGTRADLPERGAMSRRCCWQCIETRQRKIPTLTLPCMSKTTFPFLETAIVAAQAAGF